MQIDRQRRISEEREYGQNTITQHGGKDNHKPGFLKEFVGKRSNSNWSGRGNKVVENAREESRDGSGQYRNENRNGSNIVESRSKPGLNITKHERGRSFGKVKNIVGQIAQSAMSKIKPLKSLKHTRERQEANKIAALARELVSQENTGQRSHSMSRGLGKDTKTISVSQHLPENLSIPSIKRAESQGGSFRRPQTNQYTTSVQTKKQVRNPSVGVHSNNQAPVRAINQVPQQKPARQNQIGERHGSLGGMDMQNRFMPRSGSGARNFDTNPQYPSNMQNGHNTHAPLLISRSQTNLSSGPQNQRKPLSTLVLPPATRRSDGTTSVTSEHTRSHNSQRNKLNSNEKLPEITLNNKQKMFQQRIEKCIYKPMPKCDKITYHNVYHVSEYCQDIQTSMIAKEFTWSIPSNYMSRQQKISETIRSTLIDWIIQIDYNFKMLPETLFLTVNLIDRYFAKKQISKRQVQLVGVAAMLIASKYEEIYPPLLKDYVFISDNNCTADEILEEEMQILLTLDFDMQLTSSYRFLERFAKITKLDNVTFYLSQYMLELSLLDSKMNQFNHSLQAVSAIYVARKYQKHYNQSKDEIITGLAEYGLAQTYTTSQVKSCAKCMNQLAILIQNSTLQMIVQKYKHPKFFEVGRIVSSINKGSKKYSKPDQDSARGQSSYTKSQISQ